jgi:hypothetical protein
MSQATTEEGSPMTLVQVIVTRTTGNGVLTAKSERKVVGTFISLEKAQPCIREWKSFIKHAPTDARFTITIREL